MSKWIIQRRFETSTILTRKYINIYIFIHKYILDTQWSYSMKLKTYTRVNDIWQSQCKNVWIQYETSPYAHFANVEQTVSFYVPIINSEKFVRSSGPNVVRLWTRFAGTMCYCAVALTKSIYIYKYIKYMYNNI